MSTKWAREVVAGDVIRPDGDIEREVITVDRAGPFVSITVAVGAMLEELPIMNHNDPVEVIDDGAVR